MANGRLDTNQTKYAVPATVLPTHGSYPDAPSRPKRATAAISIYRHVSQKEWSHGCIPLPLRPAERPAGLLLRAARGRLHVRCHYRQQGLRADCVGTGQADVPASTYDNKCALLILQ